jgi:hypothetical protein
MTFYDMADEQLVEREVAWTDDGSGEFEDERRQPGWTGTVTDGMAAAAR